MADEQAFIEDGLRRSQIDEFFAEELGRAGYGGMEMAPTPMGIQIVLKAEKPGMVIGKGGKNIRKITTELEERFDMDDPQIDVQEVEEPDLNARVVADKLANALERGWYFRRAGHTTIDRIMESGALGAEIVLSGKVTGARSRVEKFNRGYIKHNGQPAADVVDEGQAVAVMQLGTIGVTVKIIPPNAALPDDFEVAEGAEAPEVEQATTGDGDLDDLLAEPEEVPEADEESEADDADAPTIDEEAVEEVVNEDLPGEEEEIEVPGGDEDVGADLEDLESDIESEAEDLVGQMDDEDDEGGDE